MDFPFPLQPPPPPFSMVRFETPLALLVSIYTTNKTIVSLSLSRSTYFWERKEARKQQQQQTAV